MTTFLRALSGALYRSAEGVPALANRLEGVHLETGRHIDDRFDALEAKLSTLTLTTVTSEPTEPGTFSEPAHRELAKQIDFARDLINRGLVRSARMDLERLRDEAEAIPDELKFRILTNLGACALADKDIDGACALLDEAHELQPENQIGIANAAVSAHLQEDSELAMELAVKARTSDPQNSQAAAVLIEEYWETASNRLEDFIAAEEWVTQDQKCGLVLARIRVQQSRFEEAVALCRSLVEANVEDAAAHLALSECLLSYAQAGRPRVGNTDELLAQLCEAEAEATGAIKLFRRTELKAQCQEALIVRASARAFLGGTAEAMRDLNEVLSENPTYADAVFNKGLLLLDERRPTEARAMLGGLRDTEYWPKAVLPLAHACLTSGDGKATVDLLKGTLTLEHPGWEAVSRAEILSHAETAVGDEGSVGPALVVALGQHPDDPRLLALEAVLYNIHGDSEAAEISLLNALEHADGPDRQEVLGRLAALYHSLGRYAEAADRFAEVVDDFPSHPAAIPLLVCLRNSKRLREALDWARKIRETHLQPPRLVIELEAEILDHVGDLRAAVLCLQELCSHADADPVDQVKLASAQFRSGERDSAIETILEINVSNLRRNPRLILALALMKLLLGQPDYLDDAYLGRRYGHDDPSAHLGYVALFQGRDKDWVEPEAIGPGCAVLLKNGTEESWWQILDDREELYGPHDLLPSQDLAQRLLGQGLGDTIVLREGLEDLSYEVTAVQSKYVRAFQETIEDFSTRFPGNMGLSRIDVANDDFTKIFQSVDQHDQWVRRADQMYREGRVPFSSFSSLLGRSVIEVWRASTWSAYTENDSIRIRFGSGNEEEANEASTLLREADSIVLDLLALLTVHELGLAEHLRSRFTRIAVPQHVIDEIQNVNYTTKGVGPVSGYLGKSSDGRYALTEVSEQDWAGWQEFVRSVLEFAESFDLIASYPMLDADDTENLVDVLTAAGVGAIYAGDEQPSAALVLVSDDLGLSSVARSLGIGAVNTQAVLGELLRSSVITGEAYSSWIERLALLNYWFVQVHAEDIVRRLEANGYMTTVGTRAMLRTLEGPDCSENSAVSVAAELIAELAGRAPREQMGLLLALVIATLRRGRETSLVLPKFREEVASRLALAPLTRDRLLRTVDLYLQV